MKSRHFSNSIYWKLKRPLGVTLTPATNHDAHLLVSMLLCNPLPLVLSVLLVKEETRCQGTCDVWVLWEGSPDRTRFLSRAHLLAPCEPGKWLSSWISIYPPTKCRNDSKMPIQLKQPGHRKHLRSLSFQKFRSTYLFSVYTLVDEMT